MNFFLNETHKIAFPFIRKAGSNTLRLITVLLDHKIDIHKKKYRRLLNNKPYPYKLIDQNYPELAQCKAYTVPADYKVYACIRNPYSRILSRYIRSSIYSKKMFYEYLSNIPYEGDQHMTSYKDIIKDLPPQTEFFRFELFEKSLQEILHRYDIDIKIPHIHKGRSYDYIRYYNDRSKKVIEDVYRWDIDNFNYTFDSYGDLPLMQNL